MRKTYRIIFTAIVSIMLLCMMACQDGSANLTGAAKSITVVVLDRMASKAITPAGEAVDITHYKITVTNEAEEINETSSWLAKGESFTVSNVPAGMWKATVDAYVKNGSAGTDDDYIKVATATSAETRVEADQSATLTVTLDTLLDALSGDITVTLDMPAELDDENDTFYYTYTIAGTGQRSEYSYTMDTPTQGTVDGSGNGTLTIDADAISPQLNQGAYLLTVTVFDKATEAESDVARKGVEIMRLLPGLAATGTINLNSQIVNESGFQVAITDKTGDFLNLGNAEYDDFSTDLTITIDYKSIATNTPVSVYVDGETKNVSTDFTTSVSSSNVSFIFSSMPSGRHIVTFILDEDDTQLGVNSISLEINIPTAMQISEDKPAYVIKLLGTEVPVTSSDGFYFVPVYGTDTYSCIGCGIPAYALEALSPVFAQMASVGLPILPWLGEATESVQIPDRHQGKTVSGIGLAGAYNDETLTKLISVLIDSFINNKAPTDIDYFYFLAYTYNIFSSSSEPVEIILPKSVDRIFPFAFFSAESPSSITIKGVDFADLTIASFAFANLRDTSPSVKNSNIIPYACFLFSHIDDPLIVLGNVTEISDFAFYGSTFTGDLIIPDSVTHIGASAFSNCGFTGTLTLGKNVEIIENEAFYDNSFTGELIIPDSVETIGSSAFSHNSFTGDLIIPDSVTHIGASAFNNCGFTGTLTLPEGLQTIADSAFINNRFSGNLIIPDSVTTIGSSAFGWNSFTGDLIIPDSVTRINDSAFFLNNFNGNLIIPDSVTYIGEDAFFDCEFSQIYCEAESEPTGWNGWSSKWNNGVSSTIPITWGYTGE